MKLPPVKNVTAAAASALGIKPNPPAGTARIPQSSGKPIPKLFTPLTIRGVTMPNRIWVSPMAQYSAIDGFHTHWHLAHYGELVQRGPGLVMVEATAVQAVGRASPEDAGLYLDGHVDMLRREVDFAHSLDTKIGIQLGHAGRKASTTALPVATRNSANTTASKEASGWPDEVVGPTNEPFTDQNPTPRALTIPQLHRLKEDFVEAAERAVQAGFDVVELHFAHGYLIGSFMSPAVNKRQDQYGGNFENRVRLVLEIVQGVRAAIPETMPLFVRISATDWLENNPEYEGESWTVKDSADLAVLLAARGVDVLDVSSGGSHRLQKIGGGLEYQIALAKEIKKQVGDKLLVSAVGLITSGRQAEDVLAGGQSEDDTPLDLVAAGRGFLKNPGLVWAWAEELDVSVHMPAQLEWIFRMRTS